MSTLLFGEAAFDQLLQRFPVADEATDNIFFTAWRERAVAAGRAVRAVLTRRDELRAGGKLTAAESPTRSGSWQTKTFGVTSTRFRSPSRGWRPRRSVFARPLASSRRSTRPTSRRLRLGRRSDGIFCRCRCTNELRWSLEHERPDAPGDRGCAGLPDRDPPEVRSRIVEARVERNLAPEVRDQLEAFDRAKEVSSAVLVGLCAALDEFSPPVARPAHVRLAS